MATVTRIDKGKYEARGRSLGRNYKRVFPTRDEAKAFISERDAERRQGVPFRPEAGKVTLGDYCRNSWLPGIPAARASKTIDGYRRQLETWVDPSNDRLAAKRDTYDGFPLIGRRPIGSLRRSDIQRWVEWLNIYGGPKRSGLKPNSVYQAFNVVRSALDDAAEDDLIPKNPTRKVELAPRTVAPERVLTPAEFRAVVAELDPRYRALAWVAAAGALRIGEACGLRVTDLGLVDAESGRVKLGTTLKVANQLIDISGKIRDESGNLRQSTPKTGVPNYSINLDPRIVAMVESHIAEYGFEAEHGLVFTTTRGGKPVAPSAFRRAWTKAVARVLGPDARVVPHSLRNLTVNALDRAGFPAKVARDRLRHAPTSITEKHYSSHDDELDQLAATYLADLLLGADAEAPVWVVPAAR